MWVQTKKVTTNRKKNNKAIAFEFWAHTHTHIIIVKEAKIVCLSKGSWTESAPSIHRSTAPLIFQTNRCCCLFVLFFFLSILVAVSLESKLKRLDLIFMESEPWICQSLNVKTIPSLAYTNIISVSWNRIFSFVWINGSFVYWRFISKLSCRHAYIDNVYLNKNWWVCVWHFYNVCVFF